jgi:hypothetical protein
MPALLTDWHRQSCFELPFGSTRFARLLVPATRHVAAGMLRPGLLVVVVRANTRETCLGCQAGTVLMRVWKGETRPKEASSWSNSPAEPGNNHKWPRVEKST